MELLIGLLVIVGIFFFIAMSQYNRLVKLRQDVQEGWAAIETELKRRYDLIPNLVETVKGYAGHERDTLESVMQARNAVATQASLEDKVASQNALSGALGRLMMVSEAYPQLKANENFTSLQNELSQTETRISQARRYYNAVVKEYNTACQTLPSALIAGTCGFTPKPYFGLEDYSQADPVKVSFGNSEQQALKIKLKEPVEQEQK
jgi:LemA protein